MSSGSKSSSSVPKLPAPAGGKSAASWTYFTGAARDILSKWDLLQTAVLEEWGGRRSKDKFEHILSDLLLNIEDQWKEGNDVHVDSLDVYLLECLESDFNIEFEDENVVTEVSLILQDVYRKCMANDLDAADAVMDALHHHPAMKKGKTVRVEEEDASGSEGSDDEGSDDGEDAAAGAGAASRKPHTVVDEDGWETVVRPKKKGAEAAASAAASAAPAAGGADAALSSSMAALSTSDAPAADAPAPAPAPAASE